MSVKSRTIVLATPLFPPDFGGPATYAKILLEELPKRGVTVRLVNFGSVRHLPKVVRHLAYFLKLVKAGFGADTIYALDPVSVGLPAAFASLLLGKKFLIKIVGDYAWEQGKQRFGVADTLDDFVTRDHYLLPVRLLKRIQTWVARRAERVIVPSQYLKKIIVGWGIKPEKVTVIYNSVEPIIVAESKEVLRQQFNLNGLVLVTAGRLVPWKGIGPIIASVPELLQTIPNLKLVIVGNGPLENNLKDQVKSLGLEQSIIFTGQLAQAELARWVKAADIAILNSSYEGFSHLLLEMMLIGTPIVATQVGGNGELITAGENGLLIPSGDEQKLIEAIVVMTDATMRESFAKAGLATMNNFTVDRMVTNLLPLL